MTFLLSLLGGPAYISLPGSLMGRIIAGICWALGLAILILILRSWRAFNRLRNRRYWGILIVLALLTPLTSLFIGLRLSPRGVLPLPNIPVDPLGPALMIFMAVPWILAGGFVGYP